VDFNRFFFGWFLFFFFFFFSSTVKGLALSHGFRSCVLWLAGGLHVKLNA